MANKTQAKTKPSKPKRRCGECGRLTPHFHGMYNGLGFCSACYSRVFIRKECLACSKSFRIHPKQRFEYCKTCRSKIIPCYRCNKTNYPIGLYYNDNPVCNACAVHFKPVKQCPRCGHYSSHMSKALEFGVTTRICLRCISSYYQNCDLCRKPRHPLKDKDGMRLCSKCYRLGLLDCPDCGEKYPAGRGVRCVDCSCRLATRNKAQIAQYLYERESTRQQFLEFSEWLLTHTTPLKASVSVNNYHEFFKLVDEQPDDWHLDAYALASLDKGLLRKDGYTRLFYESIGTIIPKSVLADIPTQRSIRSHVEFIYKITPYPLSEEAKEFATHCRVRHELGECKARTLKQQLSAVVSLVKYLERSGRPLNQESISEFIRHYPGLEATVTGFLIYIDGPRPKITANKKQGRSSSKAILKDYLKQQGSRAPSIKVIRAALHYLHGVPEELLNEVTMAHVYQVENAALQVRIHGQQYTIDFSQSKSPFQG